MGDVGTIMLAGACETCGVSLINYPYGKAADLGPSLDCPECGKTIKYKRVYYIDGDLIADTQYKATTEKVGSVMEDARCIANMERYCGWSLRTEEERWGTPRRH